MGAGAGVGSGRVSQREIGLRLGMNRRTVARLAGSEEPPRYRRPSTGSLLDRFESVLRRLLEEWPQIKAPRLTEVLRSDYGYTGSLRLVQARLQELRTTMEGMLAHSIAWKSEPSQRWWSETP